MSSSPVKRDIKQQRAARTREEILSAAILEFSRRSYQDTSMVQLAKAIHMTPGALYWHFATKEDLLLAAIEELHSRFIKEFTDLLTEGRKYPARKQLLGFFSRTQLVFRNYPHYGKFYSMTIALAADNVRIAGALREAMTTYHTSIAGIVAYGQRKTREFRQDVEASHVAHVLLGAFSGLMLQQNLFKEQVTYDLLATILERLAIDGLDPDAIQGISNPGLTPLRPPPELDLTNAQPEVPHSSDGVAPMPGPQITPVITGSGT